MSNSEYDAIAILALLFAIVATHVMIRVNKTGSYYAIPIVFGIFFLTIQFIYWAVGFLSKFL